jgi:hypothetical protein
MFAAAELPHSLRSTWWKCLRGCRRLRCVLFFSTVSNCICKGVGGVPPEARTAEDEEAVFHVFEDDLTLNITSVVNMSNISKNTTQQISKTLLKTWLLLYAC